MAIGRIVVVHVSGSAIPAGRLKDAMMLNAKRNAAPPTWNRRFAANPGRRHFHHCTEVVVTGTTTLTKECHVTVTIIIAIIATVTEYGEDVELVDSVCFMIMMIIV